MAKIILLLLSCTLLHAHTNSHYVPLTPSTLKQFADIGLQLTFPPPVPPKIPYWEQGLILSDLTSQKWLPLANQGTKKVILIDEGLRNWRKRPTQ